MLLTATRRFAIFGGVCCACLAVSATVGVAQPSIEAKYFSALSCRRQELFAGAHSTVAEATDLLGGRYKLKLIQIQRPDSSPIQTVTSRAMEVKGSLGQLRLTWTAQDYYSVGQGALFNYAHAPVFHDGYDPAEEFQKQQISLVSLLPFFVSDANLSPHLVDSVLEYGATSREDKLIEINFPQGSAHYGPISFGSESIAWDGGQARVRFHSHGGITQYDAYDGATIQWRSLQLPALLSNAQLQLVRFNSKGRYELAFLDGRAWHDRLSVWEDGTNLPRLLATGDIDRLALSSTHRSIYGYYAPNGTFHPINDGNLPPAAKNWFPYLAGLDGLVDFAFLNDGEEVVLKAANGVHTEAIRVLTRENNTVRELYSSCPAGNRGIEKIEKNESEYLYVPPVQGRNLVIYLHGGPVNRIDSEGSWLSDIFTLSGNPVLVVNYTGSNGKPLPIGEKRNLAKLFSAEITQAVQFAEKKLDSKFPHPVVAADSFGSLVGLVAIGQGAISPSLFLSVDGLVRSPEIVGTVQPPPDLARYFDRVQRDTSVSLQPGIIAKRLTNTKFIMIHGQYDKVVPLDEVKSFVSGYNGLHPGNASLQVIPGMGHGPSQTDHFRAVMNAVVARPELVTVQ